LETPHITPLTAFVRQLRDKPEGPYAEPYFDPCDGGTAAECLFPLEAPGPRAIKSGSVSRNNPDETAKNFFVLHQEAGIDRTRTIVWNIVPWHVGNAQQSKIWPVT
jgi:hypothetical protein